MSLQNAFEKYGEKANFYWIYISEAHAIDDPRPSSEVKIREHTSIDERKKVARECAADLGLKIPLLVDDMENTVASAYSAHPDRLFILSKEGKVAYSGGKGPFGFSVDEMVKALESMVH